MTTEGQDVEQQAASPAEDADTPGQQTTEGVLAESLITLRDAIQGTRFALRLPGADDATRAAQALVAQLDDYVLPRLRQLDAPLLAVVGGSTGAGKSTLVNSLVRTVVSPAGVLRPTTRSPVLVCHPDDAAWFSESHVLPGLSRTTGATGNHQTLHLAPSQALTAGLAFLDAPDIDSVVEANRELAAQLLAAADLWLFVTTAARYADAVPWELLAIAHERGTSLAMVLNRVPPQAEQEVSQHLREMLREHGVPDPTLFVLPETTLEAGLLPENVIGPIQVWFTGLAASADQRAAVVRQTLGGALSSVWPRASDLADASEAQVTAVEELRGAARTAYAGGVSRISTGISDGALLRGEVLARWQEFVGTGDLLRALENRVGRIRDRLTAAISGRPPRASQLKVALESGLAQLITSAAEQAAEEAAAAWRARPAGAALLAESEEDLGRSSSALSGEVERLVRDWQGGVLEMVRTEGQSKRTAARISAYGVNASGLVVMVAVFASTHFIPTGLEVAVAGGTTVLSQKLLEALFGDQAIRRLADRAREDLLNRVETALAAEEARYTSALDAVAPNPELPTRLRASAMVAESARKRMADEAGTPAVAAEEPSTTEGSVPAATDDKPTSDEPASRPKAVNAAPKSAPPSKPPQKATPVQGAAPLQNAAPAKAAEKSVPAQKSAAAQKSAPTENPAEKPAQKSAPPTKAAPQKAPNSKTTPARKAAPATRLTVTDLTAPEEKPATGKRATPRESAPARPSSETPSAEPAPDAAEEATR